MDQNPAATSEGAETLRLYDAEIARLTAAGAPEESLRSWRDARARLLNGEYVDMYAPALGGCSTRARDA